MDDRQFTILVVDDTLTDIQLGINILKENPRYTLIFATSGQQALERVKEYPLDLILLDVMMPGMNGYEVCEQLKDDPVTRHIPIIFLTAKIEQEDIIHGFNIGGVDYITKPFNSLELKARVNTHLNLKHYYEKEIEHKKQDLLEMEKVASIGLLASGLAHDFNNLLAIIMGVCDSIKRRLLKENIDSTDIEGQFETIHQSGQQAAQLVSHLLGLTQKTENKFSVIDLNMIVESIYAICSSSFSKSITFNSIKTREPALVLGNHSQLEQLLLNLFINAQHAMTTMRSKESSVKGGTLSISIQEGKEHTSSAIDLENVWVLTVEDTGVGIAEEALGHVFQPFFSTKRATQGNGLGLAIVKDVVHNHQGKIDVVSTPDKGTIFRIYLPKYVSGKSAITS